MSTIIQLYHGLGNQWIREEHHRPDALHLDLSTFSNTKMANIHDITELLLKKKSSSKRHDNINPLKTSSFDEHVPTSSSNYIDSSCYDLLDFNVRNHVKMVEWKRTEQFFLSFLMCISVKISSVICRILFMSSEFRWEVTVHFF